MISQLILLAFVVFAVRLIRKDTASRDGISAATWIPTLWVGILASRPVSAWLGTGGSSSTLDGSPADRLFFLSMIVSSLLVLSRRRLHWSGFMASNWPIIFFYAFLLLSVLWANSPVASFKRWFKEVGNIAVVLVILTEANPLQAIRVVFVRCAYVLIPLSVIFIRYFPDLGRRYSVHSGMMEATGVTFQKNSLGTMVLVCGMILLWDWLERSRPGQPPQGKFAKWVAPLVLLTGVHLLVVSDSKTSMICFALGSLVVAAVRLPLLRQRVSALGAYFLAGGICFFLIDWVFGVSRYILASLGRDMTFTGRTEVWRELLNVGTDPLLGTGFMSFWDDSYYQDRLPEWVAFSAHNGYLEVYLAGGFVGIAALVIMILGVTRQINRALKDGSDYSAVRFAILVAMLIGNFSESNFACMTPLGFAYLIAAIGSVVTIQAFRGAAVTARSRTFGGEPRASVAGV